MQEAVQLLQSWERQNTDETVQYQAQVCHTGERGRPSFRIPEDHLQYLFCHGFGASAIANMLGVSLRTVRRRMSDLGLSSRMRYSDISNNEFDETVRQLQDLFPCSGYRLMTVYLRARGITVQQYRIRESMQRCDPEGVAQRWLQAVHPRCTYSVYGPQALWHIDGNHKLIRFACVVTNRAVITKAFIPSILPCMLSAVTHVCER